MPVPRTLDTLTRTLVWAVLASLFAGVGVIRAQEKTLRAMGLTNISWALQGDVAVITYDLQLPPDTLADVRVILRRKSDPTFRFTPKSLSGAYGSGQESGTGKEIRWEFLKDTPQEMLAGEDFWFEVTLTIQSAGTSWWYYAAGGAAAAVIAAVLIFNGDKEEDGTVKPLPDPPNDRPTR